MSNTFYNEIERVNTIIADTSSMLNEVQDRLNQGYDGGNHDLKIKLEEQMSKTMDLKKEIMESPYTLYYAIMKLSYILVKVNFNNRKKQ